MTYFISSLNLGIPALSRQLLALLPHLCLELQPLLAGDGNDFFAVVAVRVDLLEQVRVVQAKALGGLLCRVFRLSQQFSCIASAAQAGLEQLALDAHHAPSEQHVPVLYIPDPGDDFHRLLDIVNREHQNFCLRCACRAQHG